MEGLTIKCPCCGREYHPAEIYFPDDLIGHPTEIIRDTEGHIEFCLGEDPNYDEVFTCDDCGTRFLVHANLSFEVSLIEEVKSDEYVTKFHRAEKVKLEENQLFD